MNPILYVLIALRSAALAASLTGKTPAADALYALADSIEAGRATEAHMQMVADKLKERELTEEDWDDLARRIAEDRDRLHSAE